MPLSAAPNASSMVASAIPPVRIRRLPTTRGIAIGPSAENPLTRFAGTFVDVAVIG